MVMVSTWIGSVVKNRIWCVDEGLASELLIIRIRSLVLNETVSEFQSSALDSTLYPHRGWSRTEGNAEHAPPPPSTRMHVRRV
jgi:hypothetical protein